MMGKMEIGLRGEEEIVVCPQDLASFMGNIGVEVLSTHRVVLLMEQAARKAIEGRLPDGMMTVGTFISIRHFAATPVGLKVRANAVLREIDGRRLVFDVVACDEFETISEGQNEQVLVSADKFLNRVSRKRVS
jgi:predicted thioesterase